jgi:hypothetical protein
MVMVLCQMLLSAECCDLSGQKRATVKLQLTCYSRCAKLASVFSYFIRILQSGHVPWFALHFQEYKQACDAFEDAQKMAPGNAEIESELR